MDGDGMQRGRNTHWLMSWISIRHSAVVETDHRNASVCKQLKLITCPLVARAGICRAPESVAEEGLGWGAAAVMTSS